MSSPVTLEEPNSPEAISLPPPSPPTQTTPVTFSTSRSRKRSSNRNKKAPGAPKRFKSSYICFFMAKRDDIKKELGDGASISAVSKRSAELWRALGAEDKAHWDAEAAKDKERYLAEKAVYTGPWTIPQHKRHKKDPTAPKRPMSAFLHFSQERRQAMRENSPELSNTEISKLLGKEWKNVAEEVRRPYIEREKIEREKYKEDMAKWKEEQKEKEAKAKKEREEQQKLYMEDAKRKFAATARAMERPLGQAGSPSGASPGGGDDRGSSSGTAAPYYAHGAWYPPPHMYYPPPGSHEDAYPPPPPPPYPFSTSGAPQVLGPNGMPQPLHPGQYYPYSYPPPHGPQGYDVDDPNDLNEESAHEPYPDPGKIDFQGDE